MFFLIRACFWILVVALLMPTDAAKEGKSASATPSVAVTGIATKAASDAASFCIRKPATCRTGIETAQAFGTTLDRGARLVTAFLQPSDTMDAPPAKPGKPARTKPPAAKSRTDGSMTR
jgi:hypothetical protein